MNAQLHLEPSIDKFGQIIWTIVVNREVVGVTTDFTLNHTLDEIKRERDQLLLALKNNFKDK